MFTPSGAQNLLGFAVERGYSIVPSAESLLCNWQARKTDYGAGAVHVIQPTFTEKATVSIVAQFGIGERWRVSKECVSSRDILDNLDTICVSLIRAFDALKD